MAVNGKNKGNAFERAVYKNLRERFGQEAVSRNIGSGSSDETADLTLYWNGETYSIECKAYKAMPWSELDKIWRKLVNECEQKEFSGEPIIVFKVNRMPWVVCHAMPGTNILVQYRYDDWLQLIRGGNI